MIITRIVPINNKRSEVYIDDRFAFVLYRGELRRYNIREHETLDENIYEDIINEVLCKRAFLRCLHLLDKRDYTESQIIRKLRDGGYPEKTIEYAVSKAKGYGYINDDSYAARYIVCHLDKKSVNSIKRTLYQRGINEATIENALNELKQDGYESDEMALIERLLIKRHYYEGPHDAKEYNKQLRYLLSKGFSFDNVKLALKNSEPY